MMSGVYHIHFRFLAHHIPPFKSKMYLPDISFKAHTDRSIGWGLTRYWGRASLAKGKRVSRFGLSVSLSDNCQVRMRAHATISNPSIHSSSLIVN